MVLFWGEFYWDANEIEVNFIWFYYYSVITFYNFSFSTCFKPFVLFLRYCEYELLQRIFEDDIVFYIAGVAIVKALLKSLFPDGLFLFTFKGSFSLVNSINAFKYSTGLNFLLGFLAFDFDFDFVRGYSWSKDFFFLNWFWIFIFIT